MGHGWEQGDSAWPWNLFCDCSVVDANSDWLLTEDPNCMRQDYPFGGAVRPNAYGGEGCELQISDLQFAMKICNPTNSNKLPWDLPCALGLNSF